MAPRRPAFPQRWTRLTQRARPRLLALMIGAWFIVVIVSGVALLNAQRDSERQIKGRFGLRADTTATFVRTYVEDMAASERRVAERELSSSLPGRAAFDRIVTLFGSNAAVLLDAKGRVLQIEPFDATLQGTALALRYDHLRTALAGRIGVSNTVASAVRRLPVMAVAVPFDSGAGRRVLSVAYQAGQTPLGDYLRRAGAIAPNRLFLVDGNGNVVAGNGSVSKTGPDVLTRAAPLVARSIAAGHRDGATSDGEYFAARAVAGTPWRVVTVAPESSLFSTVRGVKRWLPWLVWLGLIGAALLSVVLVARLMLSRRQLRASNADLDRLARVDPLTDLVNRRYLEEMLDATLAGASRHSHATAVLMIDADHFKRINDVYGHGAGDEVLSGLAAVLREQVRDGDVVGRWGGEEFVAVLPFTDAAGAEVLAERLRSKVATTLLAAGELQLSVTVSIGCAAWLSGEARDAMLHRADAALYQAKARGRDRVVSAESVHEQIKAERSRFQREPRTLTAEAIEESAARPAGTQPNE